MRLSDQKIVEIEAARQAAFRAARAVPGDRLDWSPLDRGQSVLSMVRELARTPDWAYWILTEAKPDDPEAAVEAQRREREGLRTVDDCEAACQEKLERLYVLYRTYTDEDLRRERWLPFNGGRNHTRAELLDYPRWNFAYHQGQIEYVLQLNDPKRGSCIWPFIRR